jgi:hypothetical protein
MSEVHLPGTLTATQLQSAINTLVLGLAEGIQQIRFPDGSGFTRIDATQAPGLLRMLRAELALLGGVPAARTPVTFQRVTMRRI